MILSACLLKKMEIFEKLEMGFVDMRLSMCSTKALNTEIIRLYYDELEKYNLSQYSDFKLGNAKLSRKALAKLIDYIELGQPKLILFNSPFVGYESLRLRSKYSHSPDIIFADTLKKYDNILISTTLQRGIDVKKTYYENFFPSKYSLRPDIQAESIENAITYNSHDEVPDIFLESAPVGVANVAVDNEQIVRASTPLYKIKQGRTYFIPSLPFAAFLKYEQLENIEIRIKNQNLKINDYNFNIDMNGRILMDFTKKKLYYDAFPVGEILSVIYDKNSTFKEDYQPGIFKDKIIIVELSSENTAMKTLANSEKLTEAEINANILDAYISNYENNQKFPSFAPEIINFILTLIFCLLIAFVNIKYNKKYLAPSLMFLFFLVDIILYLLPVTRWLVLTVFPLYLMFMTYLFTVFLKLKTTSAKQEMLLSIFSNRVNAKTMADIVNKQDKIEILPSEKFLTIAYYEIVNFEKLLNEVKMEDLIAKINEIVNIIAKNTFQKDGAIYKKHTNSLIAYWGAPIPMGKRNAEAKKTLSSVLKVKNEIDAVNKLSGTNYLVDIKISVHSGDMLIGCLDEDNLKSYSPFGNGVDIVQKMIEIAKTFNKDILVSEITYNLLKTCSNTVISSNPIEFKYSGVAKEKDSQVKIPIYELKEVTSKEKTL